MSSEWDEFAGEWDSNSDVIRYSEEAFKSLEAVVSLDGSNILDFGAGTGLLTEKMSSRARQVVAMDTSSKMIDVLKRKSLSNVKTIDDGLSEALIAKSDLLHPKFDLIVASSVCGFVPDYTATLSHLKSLLVPGGLFVQWDWLATEEDPNVGMSEQTITAGFDSVGLELMSLSQPFSLVISEKRLAVLMGVGKSP